MDMLYEAEWRITGVIVLLELKEVGMNTLKKL